MSNQTAPPRPGLLVRWFDSYAGGETLPPEADRIDPKAIFPFIAMHLAVLLVFVVGWSPVAVGVALALYVARMFAITGFYHRYFSHRTFKAGRAVQFAFAFLAAASAQRGPLWWASHHRDHHVNTDKPEDPHSPMHRGFWWSHMLWFLTPRNYRTKHEKVKDWAAFPELVFLDRFDVVAPMVLALASLGLGFVLGRLAPNLGTNGPQMLVWGFFVSTVVLYHATFCINSLAHVLGSRRYETKDTSRNNVWLSLVALGEGWHNNHHYYAASTRQGFYWWEIDVTYYLLRFMAAVGLVRELRPVPAEVLAAGRRGH
jgi:stearoyl-CoA desaturase (delta-9 desaturase)